MSKQINYHSTIKSEVQLETMAAGARPDFFFASLKWWEMHVLTPTELHLVLHFHHQQTKKKMLFTYSIMKVKKTSNKNFITINLYEL